MLNERYLTNAFRITLALLVKSTTTTRELVTIIALARPPISHITSFSKMRSMTSALY